VILVVDASAAVEYLLQTTLGVRAGVLFEGARLVAPEVLDVEVLSVLRREVLAGRLEGDRAAEALSDLAVWGVERCAHRPLLMAAWALRKNVSAYDALYAALAQRAQAALVTADGPLGRAPNLGVAVYNVRT
jgi:predicted nucleic acid-binding protein